MERFTLLIDFLCYWVYIRRFIFNGEDFIYAANVFSSKEKKIFFFLLRTKKLRKPKKVFAARLTVKLTFSDRDHTQLL